MFNAEEHPALASKLVELRPLVQKAVQNAGLEQQALVFNRATYNPALPVVENLLFATPSVPVTQQLLAQQPVFLGQLRELGLDETLTNLTRDVIDLLRQIFGLDGTDHPLFRKLGLEAKTYEAAVELVEHTRKEGASGLDDEQLASLLAVPFVISAEQIGPAFSDELKDRILELRHSHSEKLLARLHNVFVPLDQHVFAPGMTVMENALFGKVSQIGGREQTRRGNSSSPCWPNTEPVRWWSSWSMTCQWRWAGRTCLPSLLNRWPLPAPRSRNRTS